MTKLKFLVTGSGRSGTNYMSRFLTSIGIMCGHESIFTHDGIIEAIYRLKEPEAVRTSFCSLSNSDEWFNPSLQIADSSYMSAPYLDDPILEDTKIIHLIRNPIKVISSTFYDANFFSEDNLIQTPYVEFVYGILPQLKIIEDRLEKNIMYYILWNEMIESKIKSKNVFVHKIENGITKALFDFLELEEISHYYNDNRTNAWNIRNRDISFDNIEKNYFSSLLYNVMEKYGYDVNKCLI